MQPFKLSVNEMKRGSININAITDVQGKIIYQDGIQEDITKPKQSGEAILRSNHEWEQIFDSLPDLIMILDEKHIIRWVNKAMVDRLGTTPGKIVGRTCYKISHGKDKPPPYCAHAKMLKNGQVCTEVIHEEHLNGDFLVTVSPLYDANGRLIGAVHVVRDITERKKMEKELQNTKRLESLCLLAGGIAHDFNNIIAGILVNIGVAKVYAEKEEIVMRRLIEVENALSRAKSLTQQLLIFSKGGEPIKAPASIGNLLRDTADFASRGSNVTCNITVPDNLWKIEINEGQISQVIQNLVINGVQALPEGGVVRIHAANVTIKAREGLPLKEGRYIRITVKDQGIGIPRHHLDKIFDPFFTTKQKGSGLGLSTAYSIIKNHNGLITVESELGKGTTLYVFLPALVEKTGNKEKEA